MVIKNVRLYSIFVILIFFSLIIIQKSNACCYKSIPCLGYCSGAAGCFPITSVPAVGISQTNTGWTRSSSRCGVCLEGAIPVGYCGGSRANDTCDY